MCMRVYAYAIVYVYVCMRMRLCMCMCMPMRMGMSRCMHNGNPSGCLAATLSFLHNTSLLCMNVVQPLRHLIRPTSGRQAT